MSDWYKAIPFLCMIWSCKPFEPKPQPTPTPTVAPTPTPFPRCAVILCGPGTVCVEGKGCVRDWCQAPGLLVPGPALDTIHRDQVRAAQAYLVGAGGDPCGLSTEAEKRGTLEAVALRLRETGTCAVADEDRVLVRRGAGLWEEHHPVFWRDGCFLSNTFKGVLQEAP